jgi:hypothetical protein
MKIMWETRERGREGGRGACDGAVAHGHSGITELSATGVVLGVSEELRRRIDPADEESLQLGQRIVRVGGAPTCDRSGVRRARCCLIRTEAVADIPLRFYSFRLRFLSAAAAAAAAPARGALGLACAAPQGVGGKGVGGRAALTLWRRGAVRGGAGRGGAGRCGR